jgi:hypothetical protein
MSAKPARNTASTILPVAAGGMESVWNVIERIHAAQRASRKKTFDTALNATVKKIRLNPIDSNAAL